MRTKPVLFTRDKRYRKTGITTPRRREAYKRLQDALGKNGLVPEQVVLLEGNGKYVAENPGLVRTYLEQAELAPESVISQTVETLSARAVGQ